MSKIAITALHGFGSSTGGGAALTINGDENAITLSKGEKLEEWLADTAKIMLDDGTTTAVCEENVRRISLLVVQWLRGEELDV